MCWTGEAGPRLRILDPLLPPHGGPKVPYLYFPPFGFNDILVLANILAGFIFFFWIIAPIIYYKNIFFTSYLPIQSGTSFDRFGAKYNVTAIINDDLTVNIDKYKAYSPLYLSATFALAYGLSFASITATLVHTLLYFRKQIWVQARRSLKEQPDIHARLMSKYRQVPDWCVSCAYVQ